MSWAKENKFLTGYGIVLLLGAGFLGYKVYPASSAYDDATANYTAKASTYKTLRTLAPYPNRENLAAFEAQKKEAADVINAFQADLAKREFPIEPLTPERFQDILKKSATEITAKAKAANVELVMKEKFYFGFNRYETAPPDKDATPILGRDLKAIEWVVEQFIAAPIMKLTALNRPELPEEKGKSSAPAKPPVGTPGAPAQNLVSVHTFDVTIYCKQYQLARVLNTIISPSAPQFYIPRSIRILNSSLKAPSRIAASAPPTPDPTAPPVAAGTPAPVATAEAAAAYIVGEESVEATIRLEIVDFAEPAAPATAAAH